MGKFQKSVRRGVVHSPLRFGFDLKKWIQESLATKEIDSADLQLTASGVLFDEKLKHIWTKYNELQLGRYAGEKLRQAYVALANRDFATLRGKMQDKVHGFAGKENPYAEVMLTTKVSGALNGLEYSIDDLAASSVDGVHMPIRKTFEVAGGDSRIDVKISADLHCWGMSSGSCRRYGKIVCGQTSALVCTRATLSRFLTMRSAHAHGLLDMHGLLLVHQR